MHTAVHLKRNFQTNKKTKKYLSDLMPLRLTMKKLF
jgi:hypothetical protein